MFIKKKQLQDLLNPFVGMITKVASPMVLSNIRIISNGKQLIAQGAKYTYMLQNAIDFASDDFEILVNYEILAKLLKQHGTTIELTIIENTLNLESARISNGLPLSLEEYVTFPIFKNTPMEIDVSKFQSVIEQVCLTAGNGFDIVFFNQNDIVATNRLQLTIGKYPINTEFILPVAAVSHLAKITKKDKRAGKMIVDDQNVTFLIDDLQLISRRYDAVFPDYETIISGDPFLTIIVDTKVINAALNNVVLFDPLSATLETTETGILVSTSKANGTANISVICDIDGQYLKININPTALLKYLQNRRATKTYLEIIQTGANFKLIGISGIGYTHYIPELL